MKKYYLCFLALLVIARSFSQHTRVLFVGNSYTYVNDLPGMFSQLSLSLGDSVLYDSNAPGGYTFNLHTTNTTTLQKIALPGWDYVVLQAQSQEPSFSPTQVAAETYPYATKLDSLIHAANPCAITMFYMTWGRKYGDASNCGFYPPVCTFNGMNDRLRASYLEMGFDNFAQVSPVGVAWRKSREADSTINLWSADNSHPSIAGTYLTACVYYGSIFKQSPIGATYMAGLTAPQANFLQTIAHQTIFDSLNTWMLNQNPIHSNFSYDVVGANVQFNAHCYNASELLWNFGDGDTSTANNPQHFYLSNGTFQVELIATNECYSDTMTVSVDINSSSLINYDEPGQWHLYPNPSTGIVHLNSPELVGELYEVVDLYGSIIQKGIMSQTQLDLSQWPTGVYFLQIANRSQKIIIQ